MRALDVVVVGSINYDIFLMQDRLARVGETYPAREMRESFGGKGANQAVQCAKLGQRVVFIGAVGNEDRGDACIANLESFGIEARVSRVAAPTGLGVVNVLPDGEVHATIIEGANAFVDGELVDGAAEVFTAGAFLLLQNEVPSSALSTAIHRAREAGMKIIYNPAPVRDGSLELARRCDYLVVNEEEAMAYSGVRPNSTADMDQVLEALRGWCPGLIVTLGADGSLVASSGATTRVAAVPVQAVETTGAGDSFVGAFVSALALGSDDVAAARLASNVAAATTLGVGAQTTMPSDFKEPA